jgi:hypothetical protein
MADSDVIRKLRIYRALYRLNRAFAHITYNLDYLLLAQVFKDSDEDHPHGWQDQLSEVQAEINRRLTENLHNLEHGDARRLGRIVEMAPHIRKLLFARNEADRPAKRKKR